MTVSASPEPLRTSTVQPAQARAAKPAAVKRIAAYSAALNGFDGLQTLQDIYRVEQGQQAAPAPTPALPKLPTPIDEEEFDFSFDQPPKPEGAEVNLVVKQYLVCMGKNPKDDAAFQRTADFYGASFERFERLKTLVTQLQAG
jgi:hypothetical protein